LQGPVGVFDVGGGSTEIVTELGDRQGVEAVSLDIGAVRMTERHIVSDPPSAQELEAIRGDVRLHLARASKSPGPVAWVGIGGTVTTLCAMELAMPRYDGARVHGYPLRASAVREWVRKLSGMGVAERRALPGLEPERADVIIAGAVIVEELLGWAGVQSLTVSDRGVRWGLALRWFGTR
jgi:exopolyphosphatase/guanosine-5'-triphosphate,3'-diphosphate pyrophosphatase